MKDLGYMRREWFDDMKREALGSWLWASSQKESGIQIGQYDLAETRQTMNKALYCCNWLSKL
jgi:hypothetical protein